MTNSEKLEMLEAMVDETDEDVLSTYLNLAGAKIIAKAFPYTEGVIEVPAKYHYLQIEIAVYMLNKRGAEGQTSHSENGISRSYESADVPASMLSSITPYCGVIK
jgi:hypothetical protein